MLWDASQTAMLFPVILSQCEQGYKIIHRAVVKNLAHLPLSSSRAGDGSYQDFLNNETRYSALKRKFPERGELLFARNEQFATDRFKHLQRLVELYKPAD